MRRFTYFLFILIISSLQLVGQSNSIDLESIESIMDEYIERYNIPSLVVGIVDNEGLKHVIARGEKKRGSGIPVDQNTGYQIASLSKTFTSIIYNNLFKAGTLNQLDSVSVHLKGEIAEDALKQYAMVKLGDFQTYIRLKDILQHWAGLPNNGASVPPTPNGAPMLGGYTHDNFIKDLNELKLNQNRLNKFSYSNFGYALLGHIAEKATNKAYETLLKEYVTGPFGMEFTTSELRDDVRAKLATPYDVGDREKETKPWEMGKAIPAGGILSNVSDLSKLMVRQLNDYQNYIKSGKETALILTTEKKEYTRNGAYGYGFFESLNPVDSTIVQLGHSGDVDGFGSFYEIYPEQNLGLIMLTSSGGMWFNEINNAVKRRLFGQPIQKEVELSKSVLKRYTGKYDFGKDQIMTIFRRGNRLKTYMRGQDATFLYAESETSFFYRAYNSQFRFELDKSGKVSKAIYIQNGQEFYPKKIK